MLLHKKLSALLLLILVLELCSSSNSITWEWLGLALFCNVIAFSLSFLLVRYCSNSARFLWKSIPSSIKESQPEITAVWKIGQRLWLRDYAGVHEAIRGFDWSQDLQGLVAAFSGKQAFKIFVSFFLAE